MSKKKIPDFVTLDEAVEFWETHSFVEYADDTEEVEIEVNLPPRQDSISIELNAPLARQLQDLAKRKKTTPSHLVNKWVEQQLQREQELVQ